MRAAVPMRGMDGMKIYLSDTATPCAMVDVFKRFNDLYASIEAKCAGAGKRKRNAVRSALENIIGSQPLSSRRIQKVLKSLDDAFAQADEATQTNMLAVLEQLSLGMEQNAQSTPRQIVLAELSAELGWKIESVNYIMGVAGQNCVGVENKKRILALLQGINRPRRN